MLSDSYDVLYVHPIYHQDPVQIPMGVIGLMNLLPHKVTRLGVFSDEVDQNLIRSVKIVAMDLHWFFALAAVERLASAYKGCNPELKIVLGGYTATILAEQVSQLPAIDFVIRGDAEVPFLALITALLGGASGPDLASIPNLVGREFASPNSYSLSEAVFSSLCYARFDWFPSLMAAIKSADRHNFLALGRPSLPPFVPVNRGCPYDCNFCYGSPAKTKAIFKRGSIYRNAEAVKSELEIFSHSPDVGHVSIIGDGVDLHGDAWAEQVFSKRFDLNCYYEFFNLPDPSILELIALSFRKCRFTFPLYKNHGESSDLVDLSLLEKLLMKASALPDVVCEVFNPRPYYPKPAVLSEALGVSVRTNAGWHLRTPDPLASSEERNAQYLHFLGASKSEWQTSCVVPFMVMTYGLGSDWMPPILPYLDQNLEEVEREQMRRGCFPLVAINQYEQSDGEEWLSRTVSDRAALFRLEAASPGQHQGEGRVVDLLLRQGPGNRSLIQYSTMGRSGMPRFASGRLHWVIECESGHGLLPLDWASEGTGPEADSAVWRILDIYSRGPTIFEQEINTLSLQGWVLLNVPFKTSLIDACKFAARKCPATRLSRLIVNRDGTVQPCFWGKTIGRVGSPHKELLDVVHAAWQHVLSRRQCYTCPAASFCPKCIYPEPLTEKEYCELMRNSQPPGDILRLAFCLALFAWKLSDAAPNFDTCRGVVETSDEHLLVAQALSGLTERPAHPDEPSGRNPSRKRTSRLNPYLRLCIAGDRLALLEVSRQECYPIGKDELSLLTKLRRDGLEGVLAETRFGQGTVRRAELVEFVARCHLCG
jgi:hypothetical protein